MKNVVKPLRSASLILTRAKQSETTFYDYQILMMRRKARAPWGSILVFPGGLYNPEHDNYLQEKFGFSSELQATAVRQCFEEAGLFFTEKPVLEIQKLNELGKIRLQYIAKCLDQQDYKLTSRSYIEKLGQVFTPRKCVLPFLRLITIPQLSNRYDTTFFLHKLQDYKFINFLKYSEDQRCIHNSDQIIKCDNEFDKFKWMTPAQILGEFFTKGLSLAPPQYMIINVMAKFHKIRDIQNYLSQSYKQKDTLGNISLGPNIVSLIPNEGAKSKQFKYAATLLGDTQFPYKRHIQNQACPVLKDELQKWYENRESFVESHNRFLFNQSSQFFQHDYQVECYLNRSNLRKMMGYKQTQGRLQKEIVL